MKTRLPVHGSAMKAFTIPTKATVGAQIGVNLLDPNGNVVTAATWNAIVNPKPVATTFNGTTDDVTEGQFNLYFTDPRVYAWAKTSLIPGANMAITFDDALQTVTFSSTKSGVYMPVVTGEVPPVLVYLDDGSLVYTEIE